eukprot:scaffold307814_cov28-Tisochrysis_lutea.AAC.3
MEDVRGCCCNGRRAVPLSASSPLAATTGTAGFRRAGERASVGLAAASARRASSYRASSDCQLSLAGTELGEAARGERLGAPPSAAVSARPASEEANGWADWQTTEPAARSSQSGPPGDSGDRGVASSCMASSNVYDAPNDG